MPDANDWDIETPYGAQMRADLFRIESPAERKARKKIEEATTHYLFKWFNWTSGAVN